MRKTFCNIYNFIVEAMLEPILLASGLFFFLPHFQKIFQESNLSICAIVHGLWVDAMNTPELYIPFVAVFLWWSISKYFIKQKDRKYQAGLLQILDRMDKKLDKMGGQIRYARSNRRFGM